jgi:hypothetical protein
MRGKWRYISLVINKMSNTDKRRSIAMGNLVILRLISK